MDFSKVDWSLFANYGGFVIGVVGLLLSAYLYRLGKESKQPRCYYANFKEVEKLREEASRIRVFHDSSEVNRVYTTYIWFWNAGKKPIRSSDLPEQSKIRLRVIDPNQSVTILDHKLVKVSRSAIEPVVEASENVLLIGFTFLDCGDGFIIETQHTGGLHTEICFDGVVLGASKGVKVIPHSSMKYGHEPPDRNFVRPGWDSKLIGLLFGMLSLIGIVNIALENILSPSSRDDLIVGYVMLAVFGIGGLFYLITPWTSPFPFPRNLEFSSGEQKSLGYVVRDFFEAIRNRFVK